jgi:hypothetical protein
MKLPGFTAEVAIGKMIYTNRAQYGTTGMAPSSAQQDGVVPQARVNETFVISPGRVCYCYEDTVARMSVCECD